MTACIHVAGWTLVHFVWQGALVGLIAAVALRLLRSASPQTRYAVACGALAAMLAAPIITVRLVSVADRAGATSDVLPSVSISDASVIARASFATRPGPLHHASMHAALVGLDTILPLLVTAWFVGVAFLLLRLAGGWWRVQRWQREALAQVSSRWQAVSDRIASRLAMRGHVHVVDSSRIDTPTAVGWLRPVVLLPIAALTNLAPAQVEAILAHELAHIRRHDYLVNLWQTLAETLLFYHPVVWWVSSRIRAEREHCCDDVAVDVCGDAVDYAAALTALETWRTARTALTLAATDGSLLARVRRVLLGRVNEKGPSSAATVTVTLALLSVMLVGGWPRLSASQPTARRSGLYPLSATATTDAVEVSSLGSKALARDRLDAARPQSLAPSDALAVDLTGTWQGTMQFPPNEQTLRIILTITKTDAGAMRGLFYIIDRTPGSPVSAIVLQGTTVRFTVPGLNETYQGTLGANGSSITGSLTQGASPVLPVGIRALNLARATAETAWEIPAAPAPIAADAPLAFEVASIKPSAPGLFTKFLGFRGRTFYTTNLSVSDLIAFAYGIDARQIVNAPSWAETTTYDISAAPESAGQPTRPQALVMLQKLLADRFKLTVHREQRELPVYALTVARSGPKLTQNDSSPNGQSALRFQGLGMLPGSNATMAEFAEVMQSAVDRPIIDQTGLTGRWDFLLKWTPDESQFQRRGLAVPPPTDDPNAPPTLFTALQEQLGLRLESTRGQVDVIVIDTVDHPTPN